MSSAAKMAGLILALAMLLFSGWMYTRTGDWVAAVFAVGSLFYCLFFIGRSS